MFTKKTKKKNLKKCNITLKQKFQFKKFDIRILLENFYCNIGAQGSGKTSLNRALMNTLYKKYNKVLYKQSKEHIKELNSRGYRLDLPVSHLFYSNHECLLDKNVSCHGLKFADMIIPRNDFKGQHFPFGSILEFQEIDGECDNRKWHKFDLGHKDFFKYYRHNGLTIGCDTQDYSNCDKKVRDLFTMLLLVYGRERKKRWWQIKPRYTWYFFLKNNQLAEMLKDFSGFVNLDLPIVQAYKFTYKGEIHSFYKSRSNEPLFLNGLSRYKFRKTDFVDLSPESVAKFCKNYEKTYFSSSLESIQK